MIAFNFDDWKLIYPIEFRNGNEQLLPTDKRHSVNSSLILSANLTKRLSASLTGDFIVQSGLLSTPFHRVYFEGQELPEIEQLLGERLK